MKRGNKFCHCRGEVHSTKTVFKVNLSVGVREKVHAVASKNLTVGSWLNELDLEVFIPPNNCNHNKG